MVSVAQRRYERSELKQRLVPVRELENVRNGWLTPDGNLYWCDSWAHNWLAGHLEKLTGLKEEKFIKLSRGEWYPEGDVSIKQFDTIWDWCKANGEDFPETLIDDPLYAPRQRGKRILRRYP
jgi:hypothetical protein